MRTPDGLNLTNGLCETLGRSIVGGTFEDGFPTEAELSRLYGLSRSVTREAVKMLTAKGLLSARPKVGTVVEPSESWNLLDPDVLRWLLERKFSLELLRQFTELRIAIEPAAAALAARTHDEERLRAITAGLERMVAAEAGDDDVLNSDIAFHVAVLEASGNPFYRQFRDVVGTALRTSIRFTNRFNGRTADLDQHRTVLDAIERRDAEGAQAAMAALIVDVRALIAIAEQEV